MMPTLSLPYFNSNKGIMDGGQLGDNKMRSIGFMTPMTPSNYGDYDDLSQNLGIPVSNLAHSQANYNRNM
jgi:hypothetical protein